MTFNVGRQPIDRDVEIGERHGEAGHVMSKCEYHTREIRVRDRSRQSCLRHLETTSRAEERSQRLCLNGPFHDALVRTPLGNFRRRIKEPRNLRAVGMNMTPEYNRTEHQHSVDNQFFNRNHNSPFSFVNGRTVSQTGSGVRGDPRKTRAASRQPPRQREATAQPAHASGR